MNTQTHLVPLVIWFGACLGTGRSDRVCHSGDKSKNVVANDQNGELIYDHTGIGIAKDNINTSIGMKKMPVLVLARLAEIKITGTGITLMTVLVLAISKCLYWNRMCSVPELALLEKGCQYQYRHFRNAHTGTGILIPTMPVLIWSTSCCQYQYGHTYDARTCILYFC